MFRAAFEKQTAVVRASVHPDLFAVDFFGPKWDDLALEDETDLLAVREAELDKCRSWHLVRLVRF